jgi:hypothetical protein
MSRWEFPEQLSDYYIPKLRAVLCEVNFLARMKHFSSNAELSHLLRPTEQNHWVSGRSKVFSSVKTHLQQ